MWILSGLLSLFSLVYWLIIVLYNGLETVFASFWLWLSILSGLIFLSVYFFRKRKDNVPPLPLWLTTAVKTLFYLCGFVVVLILIQIFIGSISRTPEDLDYVVVLGTYEQSDYVTDHLKSRLDRAVAYLQENETTMVIVSGGKSEGSVIPQSKTMSDYLMLQGINSSRIVQEKQSTNTRQSIWYSERLIPAEASVGIVTSDYHVYRAVQTAKTAGLESVYGVSASGSKVMALHYIVREGLLIFYDKWMGLI